jgi:zinc transporter ZupT
MSREPAVVKGAIVGLLGAIVHVLVVVTGVELPGFLDPTTLAGVLDFVAGAIAVWLIRRSVTPVADPRDEQGRPLVIQGHVEP